MRVLAIDYGEQRIGIAASDPEQKVSLPIRIIESSQKTLNLLKEIIEEYEVSEIVFGLPKDKEGNDSKKATEVRLFAETLKEITNLPILFWDERYSTKAVKQAMIQTNLKSKKKKKSLDAHAAAFFLQGYLDSKQRSL
jgi:putative holliday junction resolvase